MLAVYNLWAFVAENWHELVDAFVNTLEVSAIAIAGSAAIGVALGAARAHRVPVVSQLAAVYVEIIRNTPILVQIFMLFFALPQAGIRLDAFTVAWLAVMIWGGAFNTENFRAGFEAVPYRYREAAYALWFGGFATFLNVTLPIGGRIALPSSINTHISVVKNTSLMYVIGYAELTTTAINIANLTLETLEALTVLAIVYLTLVWGLSAAIRLLESRLAGFPRSRRSSSSGRSRRRRSRSSSGERAGRRGHTRGGRVESPRAARGRRRARVRLGRPPHVRGRPPGAATPAAASRQPDGHAASG